MIEEFLKHAEWSFLGVVGVIFLLMFSPIILLAMLLLSPFYVITKVIFWLFKLEFKEGNYGTYVGKQDSKEIK